MYHALKRGQRLPGDGAQGRTRRLWKLQHPCEVEELSYLQKQPIPGWLLSELRSKPDAVSIILPKQ